MSSPGPDLRLHEDVLAKRLERLRDPPTNLLGFLPAVHQDRYDRLIRRWLLIEVGAEALDRGGWC